MLDTILNFLGHTLFTRILGATFLVCVAFFGYRWIVRPLRTMFRGLWDFWRMRNRPDAVLEITPPTQIEKSPHATQQLFAILQELIGKGEVMPLEIEGTKKEGIRYLIHTHPSDIALLQRQLASYLPEAKFRVLESVPSTESENKYRRVFEIKQSRHYAYPLQPHEELTESDPADYIAGAMTKLQPNERITMQLVLAPHYSNWTNRLRNQIHNQGYAVIDHKLIYFIRSRPLWVWIITVLYALVANDLQATVYVLAILLAVSLFTPSEEPTLTQSQQELYASILAKLGQPLFRADIRILVSVDSNERMYELSNGITSSLAPLSSPGFQKLYVQRARPDQFSQKTGIFKMYNRMPSLFVFGSNVLAASELASIYHFPYGTIETEGMVRSHSRTLPAALGMKNNKFDVVLGQNNHHGEITPIGLTVAERERHVYIIGGTGNGKTTMLEYAMIQDIKDGKGLAFVDPHGDAAEFLLRHIPEERINDVIYFNPDDLAHPIGLNLLELTPGLEGDELLREKDMVTEAAISVFRKIFSDEDNAGHRIEYVLRNSIQTALTIEGATIFTIFKLLNDPKFRKNAVAKLEDEDLRNFWKNELGKAGEFQRVKMSAGITAKIGRFLFSASAKRILKQPKSTINFDDVLDGKILICNFSKGLIGEDTSELFGITVLAKLQLAALRRARTPQAKRKPFYLYVDEFQNFATTSFVQLLSEARKYKLFLTMAEQSTSQQEEQQMVNVILANVGTVICFRSGNPADERMTLPLFRPYVEEGEIANLPSFNFYIRISAVHSQEPFSGETIVPEEADHAQVQRIVTASQKNYTLTKAKKEAKKESSEASPKLKQELKLPDRE